MLLSFKLICVSPISTTFLQKWTRDSTYSAHMQAWRISRWTCWSIQQALKWRHSHRPGGQNSTNTIPILGIFRPIANVSVYFDVSTTLMYVLYKLYSLLSRTKNALYIKCVCLCVCVCVCVCVCGAFVALDNKLYLYIYIITCIYLRYMFRKLLSSLGETHTSVMLKRTSNEIRSNTKYS